MSKYERTVPISSYSREPCRRNKDPNFNVTICMPRVGRNRIHLNHEHNTSTGLKRELGLQRQWPRGNESGKDRHDHSKGHLTRTRNSFLFRQRGEVISPAGKKRNWRERGRNRGELAWAPREWINCYVSVTSAAMESKTPRLHSGAVLLSIGNDLKKKKKKTFQGDHPYATALCRGESRRICTNENPHVLDRLSVQRREQIEIVEQARCLQFRS